MRLQFCLLLFSRVLADDSCPSRRFTTQGGCCDLCPKGHGVIKECNTTNTQCQPCENGVTFSPSAGLARCQLCSSCPDKMEVGLQCSATFDTQCQCVEGYYSRSGGRRCVPCATCRPGFGAVVECHGDRDAMCQPCPEGSFSEKPSSSQPCTSCRVCGEDHFVLKCKATSDTICRNKSSLVPKRPQVEPMKDDAKFMTSLEPESSTVMGAIMGLGVLADDSCPSRRFTTQGECCDLCPKGHGVIKECNTTNTQCQPCENGVTFSPSAGLARCQLCSSCPDKMEVGLQCSATFDTQCQCVEGYYSRSGGRRCVPCATCRPGFGSVVECHGDRDADCQPCPEGSFSEKPSSSQPCTPCRVCGEDHFVLKCEATSDTICRNKSSLVPKRPQVEPMKDDAKFMTSLEFESSTVMGAINFTAYDTGKNIIPVYCSILAAVIVGLVIYVTVKCWNTCKQKKQLAKARAGELDVGPEGEKLHSDSGVFVDTHSLHEPQLSKAVRTDPPLYSKLPLQKREEVERLLGSQGANRADWRNLAHLLGYDEERVATIGRGEDPAHTLLSDWSMRDGASLDVLCKALGRMERDDVAERLKPEPAVTSVV